MLASYNFQNKSSILTFFITFLLASSGKLARNSSSSRERPCLGRVVSFSGAFSKSHRWLFIMQWSFGVTLNLIQSMLRACKICGEMQRNISSRTPDIAGKFSLIYSYPRENPGGMLLYISPDFRTKRSTLDRNP